MDWREDDLQELERRGIAVEEAERQLKLLRKPSNSVNLERPAVAGDGITVIPESEISGLIDEADETAGKGRVQKFVPASGAATRMFAELMPALEDGQSLSGSPERFFQELENFPFADQLRRLSYEQGVSLGPDMDERETRLALRLLLTDEGLGYSDLAKGLIPFHRYPDEVRTAFEEQVREGILFASDGEDARFHFTVPQSDLGRFSVEEKRVARAVRDRDGVRCRVVFSVQHPSTDTVAMTSDGEPFRTDEGDLLLRPGGHGSLLRNLIELGGDVVFVKNIDNVRPQHVHRDVARWYKVLIGHLVSLEERVRNALRAMEDGDPTAVTRAAAFAEQAFARPFNGDRIGSESMKRHTIDALRRPIRVCAVVRNEGEPGGAPFWVRETSGRDSLQIVESSQVDMANPKQKKIFGSSTHFNPVAIACSVRDPAGKPYDLRSFVDPEAAFVAQKTHQGRELRALEHPGLWNGGMAGWNSVFVEVPAFTFAPVKTVFDLLRDEHRTDGDGL
ncbi:MAG: DUF4301 family protein [Acidobacteria bacterium]|nr:DUF4301 family protein [Acidobacteriota bacterium]